MERLNMIEQEISKTETTPAESGNLPKDCVGNCITASSH